MSLKVSDVTFFLAGGILLVCLFIPNMYIKTIVFVIFCFWLVWIKEYVGVVIVVETKTQNMIEKCLEMTAYEAQYRIPWIVFDRDQVPNFDQIIRDAEKVGINVGWSNPCFEIWMYAYFGSMPAIHESWTCCSRFADLYEARTGQKYSKADSDMYKRLCENGDEDKALQIAVQKYEQCLREGKRIPSEICPATTVHNLVGEIRRKVKG